MRDRPPDLAWPRFADWPSRVPLVYLDLNHWIALAQARVGHPQGADALSVLLVCSAAARNGAAKFVLSASHYAELGKIRDPAQRHEVAAVMEELTGFASLLSRTVVLEYELEAALDRLVLAGSPLPRLRLVDQGVRHALGLESGVRIVGPEGDVIQRFRTLLGTRTVDAFLAAAELRLDRSVLRGPTDADLPRLEQRGWKPSRVEEIAIRRAEQERWLTAKLREDAGQWRRGRLRDVVATREHLFELDGAIQRALAVRSLDLEQVGRANGSVMAFIRSMPGTEVAIALKTAWHRNQDKSWTANDIHDIDAMSLAMPYCDIVVTEKACHHELKTARLNHRMKTVLLRRLADLPAAIEEWKPRDLNQGS
jgi:hypothetical protein